MKISLTLLITMVFIACKGQDTVCFICYSQEQWDSATAVCDSQVNALEQKIVDMQEIYQNPELYGDTEITIYDSLGTKVVLTKKNQDLWYNIFNDSKRYNFWIVDSLLKVWIGDTTNVKLILQYDLK